MNTPTPSPSNEPTALQARLRALGTLLDLHDVDLAALLGVPAPTLRNWMIGHREPAAGIGRLLDIVETLALFSPAMLSQWIPATRHVPGRRGRPPRTVAVE